MTGGSGRGNKCIPALKNIERPDCPFCGGWLMSNGKNRWKCKECDKETSKEYSRVKSPHEIGLWGFDTARAEKYARKCEKRKRLIVTSAQNNTPPHRAFLDSLLTAAEFYGAELAIIPSHYKNVTLMDKSKKSWHDELEPYLVKSDIQFGNVLIKSDVKVNATALWPLAGKEAHGGPEHWVVFGHPQISMEPVASPGCTMPKKLFTTGSCTELNYSISDLGERAKFHHVFGALIIEKAGDHCFVRQLMGDDDGSFFDLDRHFSPCGVTSGHRIAALTPGDEHVKFNACREATYSGKNSMVRVLNPEIIVRHDVLDGYAGSHHHKKDPMIQFKKYHNGDNDYRAELEECIRFINETTPENAETWIVPSNHHDHFFRFLNETDLREDHTNAILIAEMNLAMRKAVAAGENYDPFQLYCSDRLTCAYRFLDRNEPALIGGVDHSQHGDVGINGMRGNARMLARTSYKMTVGHSHSARICKGVFQTGTSAERMEYERGLSNHSISHVIQYQNGKRAVIDIIDGRWRA